MLILEHNFYTNRTQDNYLQQTHSRHSLDWQEGIIRFRGGARGGLEGATVPLGKGPQKLYFSPLVGKVSPRWKIPGATPESFSEISMKPCLEV